MFIIPAESAEKIQKIAPPKEIAEPLPGFYEAVFKKSIPAIFDRTGLATLLFILLVSALKFFTAHLNYIMRITYASGGCINIYFGFGWLITAAVWGGLFWVYAEIIYAAAFDIEVLPTINFEGGFGYIFKVMRSFYAFFIALLVSLFPAIIANIIFNISGIGFNKWLLLPFIILALLFFPMAVLTISISRDITLLWRYDYFLSPIVKAFRPYLLTAAVLATAWQFQFWLKDYGDLPKEILPVGANLGLSFAAQILTIFSMRIIGLFYRHFSCYFRF